MLNISMPKSPIATKTPRTLVRSKEAAAAELVLKAHALASNPEMLADMANGDAILQEIADMIDLTEAPEDAVCSLVIDLMQYCEREKIDWNQDVMLRSDHGRTPPPKCS